MSAEFPRHPGAASARVVLLAIAGAAAVGCSHNHAYLPLEPALRDAVKADLAVAGVLDRRGDTPGASRETSARLAEAAGAADVSALFKPGPLAFLMATPAELFMSSEKLATIRRVVGHRYLLVGQQGAAPVDHYVSWCPYVLLPFPFATLGFRTVRTVSEEYEVAHAAQILRLIDLEEGAVIAECHTVLSEPPDGASAWRGEIRSALAGMALR